MRGWQVNGSARKVKNAGPSIIRAIVLYLSLTMHLISLRAMHSPLGLMQRDRFHDRYASAHAARRFNDGLSPIYELEAPSAHGTLQYPWTRGLMGRSFPWLVPYPAVDRLTRPDVIPAVDRGRLAHDPVVRGDQDRFAGDHRGKEGVLQLPGSRVDSLAADPSG